MLPRIKRKKIKKIFGLLYIAIYIYFLNAVIINQPINPRLISFVLYEFYCLAGYSIDSLKSGTFQSILYEKSKQRINQYKNIKKEVDKFIILTFLYHRRNNYYVLK